MPLVTGRHGIGLWLLCLPLALCGCLENGDVDAREPADALLRVVSGHEVDLGEVEASTDVRVPSAVAMFEIENPTDEPVEVLSVVRSCGCLEFEPIREIPCGRSQIRIGVRPQAGRALRQSLWFLLANKQKLELVVHCRTLYAPTIEIGIPRWEIPGSILLMPRRRPSHCQSRKTSFGALWLCSEYRVEKPSNCLWRSTVMPLARWSRREARSIRTQQSVWDPGLSVVTARAPCG